MKAYLNYIYDQQASPIISCLISWDGCAENIIIRQMSKAISEESQKQQNCIYDLLPEARPLHSKSIIQPKSVYQFVAEPAPNSPPTQQSQELMEIVAQDRNLSTHQIGTCLAQIFKEPIYQSYQEVSRSDDNNRFATCTFNHDPTETIRPVDNKAVDDTSLIFESRFESGNLAFVSRSLEIENYYYLALQRDTNSLATSQWYYFYVENRENLGTYTFSIVNLIKTYSAYENGMKPCVFSIQSGLGWRRQGFNIGYQKNSLPFRGERHYYSLQFSYTFVHKSDRVYFAYSYPYTFTKLQNFINEIQINFPRLLQVKVLAKTLIDNPVNILSITNPRPHSDDPEHRRLKKDLIMICARVHPGETNSSFACEGLIRFLLSDSEEANNFRTHFIIKIVPFLNPDGVIHGNYRTSLSGHDLNRRWKRPDKNLHPEICAIKKYLTQTTHRKVLFIDLHGHSKKRSSFMYGCLNKQNPYLCKELPFILSKNGHHFCYFNCNFSTPASRQGTSRMNVWKQFKVDYSYTMQISFCGPVRSKIQFMVKDYIQMGFELGKVISSYFCGKIYNISSGDNKLNSLLKELYSQKQLLDQGLQQSSGSQSGDQEKIVQQTERKQERLTISNKESTVELNGILTKYLNETKAKWTKKEGVKSFSYKSQQKAQLNIRIRKELAPSRISIQKIDLSEQVINPYYNFGFIKGNIRLTSREMKGKQSLGRLAHRNSYGPYSSNKAKLNQKPGDEYSLMLPKVLRQEQIKYRKYRKNECKFEISLNHEQFPVKQSTKMGHPQTSREISLAEKILQTTQRPFHESGRYWIRNS